MGVPADALTIVGLSTAAVVASELASKLMIAASSTYKKLVTDIERAARELERVKAGPQSASTKKRDRALDVQLAELTRQYYYAKMRQLFVSGLFLMGTFYFLGSRFSGVAVAKLPFVPFKMFKGLTHRGLDTADLSDCSYIFLYGLCAMTLKVGVHAMHACVKRMHACDTCCLRVHVHHARAHVSHTQLMHARMPGCTAINEVMRVPAQARIACTAIVGLLVRPHAGHAKLVCLWVLPYVSLLPWLRSAGRPTPSRIRAAACMHHTLFPCRRTRLTPPAGERGQVAGPRSVQDLPGDNVL